MHNLADSVERLSLIQRLALERDGQVREALQADGHMDLLNLGGALFLGRYYGASAKIYFGLNPGTFGVDPARERVFEIRLRQDDNGPFDFEGPIEFPYWRNMRKFLNDYPNLKSWFNDRVTHAFLVPWRTRDANVLNGLNPRSREVIHRSSAELAAKIIEDHKARIVIVAGKKTLYLLNEFLNLGLSYQDMARNTEGAGGVYQWKSHMTGRGFTVLQIPHFSRANSRHRMEPLASWLNRKLEV